LLEITITTGGRLLLYKKMYQDCLNYLFHEIQSAPVEADLVDENNENIEYNKEYNRFLF
jgi:hypothetical protein